jgi:hypothetical protein
VAPAQLSLTYGDASCAPTAAQVLDLATNQPVQIDAPDGVTLGAAPASFSFNGLGQPSAAAAISVGARTITVNAETGYVQ